MTPELPAARANRWQGLAWAIKAAQVRLRFLIALAVAFGVVGRWDVLRTYWDRWTGPAARDATMGAVSADTEYFCPMDPGVLSQWPGKCPVCYMALVRRKVGDMGPTPEGVVARVQLSPARVQLAGIATEPAAYRPLAREIRTTGALSADGGGAVVVADVSDEEASWIAAGMTAGIELDPPDGSAPVEGRVRSIKESRLTVELPSAPATARYASVTVRVPVADREPFRSLPRDEPPTRPGEPRYVYTCPDHADVLGVEPGRCPKDDLALERLPLAKNQRASWWCPMHPAVVSAAPGATCGECGRMVLVPRVNAYCPAGEVLAVPESAVIDTGVRKVVYVERMPGVFDGVEVRLGPRIGAFYPVVSGLEAGQRVARWGAFLLDAETRLNPSLAVGYFGAKAADAAAPAPGGLSADDRARIVAQATCPVTGKRLGSMGTPFKLSLAGRTVFLCCAGCKAAALASPRKTLEAVTNPAAAGHHP